LFVSATAGLGLDAAWVVGDLSDHDTVVNLLRLGGVERPQ